MRTSAKLASILFLLFLFTTPAMAVTLELSASDTSAQVGVSVSLTARLMNGTLPLNNTSVNFSTNFGSLSSFSSTTNDSGFAIVIINSTVSGNLVANASSGTETNTTIVSFLPAPVTDIIFDINNTDPVAGDEVDVNVTARDQYGNINNTPTINIYLTMEDVLSEPHNENIALSEGMGNMFEISIDHNNMTSVQSVEGTALLLRITSTLAGTLSIGSETLGIINNTSVVYAPSTPYSMEALYDDEYIVNTTSDIVVSLHDRYENPIEGSTLTFNVTSPADTIYNSPITYNSSWVSSSVKVTPVDGKATVSLRTDKRAGENIVNVDALNTSLFLRLSITGIPDIANSLTLSSTPSSCYANNEDYYRLSAQVIDQFLNPLLPESFRIKDQVIFESNSGSTLVPLNNYGVGTTVVGPTPYVENITVTATYKDETGSTNINSSKELSFSEGPLSSFNFYSNPNIVLLQNLSGNHNSSVIVIAFDAWGHPLQGVNITLNNTAPSLGNLSMDGYNGTNIINATTDQHGRVNTLFTSSNIADNCTLIATSGAINDSLSIEIRDQPFISTYIDAEPYVVNSGDIVNVTTIISVEGELPISRSAATSMLVIDRSGSMDPDSYAGTPLDVVLVLDRSGSMNDVEPAPNAPEQPLTDALAAAKTFLDNLVSNSQVGVVSFSSSSTKDLSLTLLNSSDNEDHVKYIIDNNKADGGTAIGLALADANEMLMNGRPSAKKIVILLTDGVSNTGSDVDGVDAANVAKSNGIIIYTIGLGDASYIDEPALRYIARETGGTYYNAPTSSELEAIYNSIAQEVSDYDVTAIKYSEEGFTPYGYDVHNSAVFTQDSGAPYWLVFDAWDMDSGGECKFTVNGNSAADIGFSGNYRWRTFKYNITSWVTSGSNNVVFYDPSNYLNAIQNVRIIGNGALIASFPDEVIPTSSTPYTVNFDTFYYYYEDTFLINKSLNDLKVKLDWTNASQDLALSLISPTGKTYGIGADTTGYYPNSTNDGISESIWLMPLSYVYPDDDAEVVETGNWIVRVSSPSPSDSFDLDSYIDKKSATQIASKAFISSFDDTRGDLSGLVLYSNNNIVTSDTQSSYLYNGSEWVSYFTPGHDAVYNFELSWNDSSTLDISLYEGTELLASSSSISNPKAVNTSLFTGNDYHIIVNKSAGTENDTSFTVNATSKQLRGSMSVYYDSGSTGVPRERVLEGGQWSVERSSNYVGGSIRQLILEESPVKEEIILGTGDDSYDSYDFNVQVWDGSTWSGVQQFSSRMDSYATRGFDIGYESVSGDALAVYMDMNINDGVAQYRVWDGSWSPASSTNAANSGAGDVRWVEVASHPSSDEMVLVTLDDERDIRAQVWDGSSWVNPVTITNDGRATSYQCFDVAYEQQSGIAIVVWSDVDGWVHSRIWDGSAWGTEQDLYNFNSDHRVYWIKMDSDTNSDNIILGMENLDCEIFVNIWNGSSWDSWEKVTNNCYEYSKRIFDVTFERNSGDALIVWGDSTNTPKYLIWNGSAWGTEGSTASLAGSGYARWVNLEPNPDSDEISLITSDGNSDINIQKWDGSSWDVPYEVETSSSHYYEVSDIVYPWKDTSYSTTELNWKEWRATVTSSLSSNSFDHLGNSIDTITADGLTAIDEGLYEANNELSAISGNSTVVLMSDGMDNAGHHSLIEEALRAKEHNTIIHTVGLGKNEDEVDPILYEVANITGGEYYFAPNSTVLEDIFVGIASELTNFTASGPTLSIHIPNNYINELSIATATYIPNSTNSTFGNVTNFPIPMAPSQGNLEPTISTEGTRSELLWNLPSMIPGQKWGVWYQLKVQGAGSVPLILPTSSINYTDVNETNIDIKINYEGETGISGFGADVDYVSLGSISIVPEYPTVLIGEDAVLNLNAFYSDGNPAIADMQIYSSIGMFNETENPMSITVSGSDQINLMSMMAGSANIKAIGSNGNNSVSDNAVVYIRPKGVIMLS